jgi:ABC-2 type transport system permease protein
MAADKQSTVQVLVDGTDANNARVIKNSIKATTQSFLQAEKLIPEATPITTHTRLWFNPGREESLYIVPGVYAVVLWIFPSLLAAIAMVREKEKGTILQVYASDLSATELILGKVLAYEIVGLGMALGVMVLGGLIFHLRFAGGPTPLLLGTPLYVGASVMFGSMLGARASSQNAAVQGVSLIGFLTALLLSGFIYPLSNIPFPLSLASNIIPARYFITITRDAYVRGVGWVGVWFSLLMILGLGFLLFNVTRKALSRMQLGD